MDVRLNPLIEVLLIVGGNLSTDFGISADGNNDEYRFGL